MLTEIFQEPGTSNYIFRYECISAKKLAIVKDILAKDPGLFLRELHDPRDRVKMHLGAERLRNTYIRHLLYNGVPIQSVARQVGHSLGRTVRHSPKLTITQILNIYKQTHPKA